MIRPCRRRCRPASAAVGTMQSGRVSNSARYGRRSCWTRSTEARLDLNWRILNNCQNGRLTTTEPSIFSIHHNICTTSLISKLGPKKPITSSKLLGKLVGNLHLSDLEVKRIHSVRPQPTILPPHGISNCSEASQLSGGNLQFPVN